MGFRIEYNSSVKMRLTINNVPQIEIITLIDLFRISISSQRKSQEKKQQQPELIRAIVSRMLRGLLIALDILVAAGIIETIMVPSLF